MSKPESPDPEYQSGTPHLWTDLEVETKVGNLLRAGVLTSAVLVGMGAVGYLVQHGSEQPHYGKFNGEPGELRHAALILQDAFTGHSEGIIQFGLLVLIATPVARVMLAAFAFLKQGDRFYLGVSLVVLVILTASLLGLSP
ncbi:MAG: DUF1634 domain-containing protein [Planctomycetaceae bacterium]